MDYEKSYKWKLKLHKEYMEYIKKMREENDKKRSKHTKAQQENT